MSQPLRVGSRVDARPECELTAHSAPRKSRRVVAEIRSSLKRSHRTEAFRGIVGPHLPAEGQGSIHTSVQARRPDLARLWSCARARKEAWARTREICLGPWSAGEHAARGGGQLERAGRGGSLTSRLCTGCPSLPRGADRACPRQHSGRYFRSRHKSKRLNL